MRIASLKTPVLLVAIGVIIIALIAFLHTFVARANIYNLYATTCLGGWENTHLATGMPEAFLTDGVPIFIDNNSARLSAETLARIYCGGFTGDILENTIPQKIRVRLSLAIKYPDLSHLITPDPDIDINKEPATETPISDTVPATNIENIENITEEVILPIETETIVPQETIVLQESVSPSNPFDVMPHTPETDMPEAQSLPPATITDSPQVEQVEQVETAIESSLLKQNEASVPEDSYGLLEVMYTLDGTEWKSLGFIKAGDPHNKYFEIPIEKASRWEDISKIQIGIHNTPILDSLVPTIYLDAVWLEVEYQNLLEDPFPPPGSLEGDIIISTTPFENMAAVLVSRESKSILQGPRHELWISSVSPYSDNPFMTEWRFVAEDAILSDNPRIIFSEDGLFWSGENDENVWRFNPLSGSYESVSRIPGESTELPFDDLSGEPHKLQASPQGDLEIIETHDKPIATE